MQGLRFLKPCRITVQPQFGDGWEESFEAGEIRDAHIIGVDQEQAIIQFRDGTMSNEVSREVVEVIELPLKLTL